VQQEIGDGNLNVFHMISR